MAEANLFRIRGITGVADTEASNMQGYGEEMGRGERREEECSECVDRELIVFWQGSGHR